MKIIELEEVDSTNEYCKREKGDNLIVTAKRQTCGRGTKGRSFVSSDGGLYVSVKKSYKNFPAAQGFKIMINTCVAVCKTVQSFGLEPVIRWPNDVLAGGKKICGTLIESTLSGGFIKNSIVGIGINISNILPVELADIAVTMSAALNRSLTVDEVKRELLKNLDKEYTVKEYKNYINWFNKPVDLHMQGGAVNATALDIAGDGRLVVEVDGEIKKISSAEVSLRL